MSLPRVGAPAPPFAGTIQDGSVLSLEALRGRRVALYFYPRDNTSVCTKQACSLRDGWDTLASENITVVGVSDDPAKSHAAFAGKLGLPFPLIADVDHAVTDAYGMWVEKSMYGRKYMGTQRSTFLIDEAGMLRGIIEKPDTGNHAAEIVKAFRSIVG